MSQYASGVDEEGVLQIDVIVRGEVPDLSNGMELTLTPYYENYIQTGQGERTPALILISLILSFIYTHRSNYNPDNNYRSPAFKQQVVPQMSQTRKQAAPQLCFWIQQPLRKWQSPLKKMSTFTSDMSTSTVEMSTQLSLY